MRPREQEHGLGGRGQSKDERRPPPRPAQHRVHAERRPEHRNHAADELGAGLDVRRVAGVEGHRRVPPPDREGGGRTGGSEPRRQHVVSQGADPDSYGGEREGAGEAGAPGEPDAPHEPPSAPRASHRVRQQPRGDRQRHDPAARRDRELGSADVGALVVELGGDRRDGDHPQEGRQIRQPDGDAHGRRQSQGGSLPLGSPSETPTVTAALRAAAP